jgi:heme A synthase
MSDPGHDAQRDMERRALRNVRGLVDKIESDDKLGRRAQVRTLIGIVAVAVAVAVALGIVVASRDRGNAVVVAPPKPGQVMPQAPRAPQ